MFDLSAIKGLRWNTNKMNNYPLKNGNNQALFNVRASGPKGHEDVPLYCIEWNNDGITYPTFYLFVDQVEQEVDQLALANFVFCKLIDLS